MWEALFLILAIAAVLVVLRLAKKAGLDIIPCGVRAVPRAEARKDDKHLIVK